MKNFFKNLIEKIKKNKGLYIYWFIVCLIFIGLNMYSIKYKSIVEENVKSEDTEILDMSYLTFKKNVETGDIKKVTIDFSNETFEATDINNKTYEVSNPRSNNFKEYLLDNGIEVYEITVSQWKSLLINILELMLYLGLMFFLFSRMMPSSKSKKTKIKDVPNITFNDISGCKELKNDLEFIVKFLKNPKLIKEAGARMPKGIILYGPPGTGKTLFAKAIAGTAGVPFFSVSGSEFIEMYVGLGAKRVRNLYSEARKNAPCIVFIDEIDAIGGKRKANGGNSELDQVINQLLTELDGFNGLEGVITIAATNRLDNLDSALTRPGRIDKQLAVPLPDKDDRLGILKIYAKNKKFKDDVDFNIIASMTVGFSGAIIENLMNEATLLAVMDDRVIITKKDIDTAFYKIVMKGNKKEDNSNRDLEELKIVAYHEAGHTLATKLLTNDDVPKVTILSSTSGAGGVTFRTPEEISLYSKEYLKNLIKIMYAGRAAEYILFNHDENKITIGASNDISQATNLIKTLINNYGMNDYLGMINLNEYAQGSNVISSDLSLKLLNEASDLSKELYQDVINLLEENKDILIKLSENLLEKETLDSIEINNIISKKGE